MDTKTEIFTVRPLAERVVGMRSLWRWAVPLLALVALAVLLLSGSNVALFYWMNRLFSHAPDALWTHLSMLADGQFIILFALPFLGRRPDIVWQYILAALLGGLYVPGMKELFSEWRPPAVLVEGSFHLIGPALQNNAFPSGHTTAAFALAGLLCLQRVDLRIKFAALLLATLVGFSRIANGVHWPLDVLGGMLGGWLVANAAVWLSNYWQAGMKRTVQRIFALILTPLAIWGIWSLWKNLSDVYPDTNVMKVVFLVVCLSWSLPGQLQLFNLHRKLVN